MGNAPQRFSTDEHGVLVFCLMEAGWNMGKINDKLRKIVRVTEGKKPEPTAGIIDSQSNKTTEEARSIKGFDAGKK